MKSPSERIRRIQATGVNEVFQYDIEFDLSFAGQEDLRLIYGENGTGKSTLLQAIFHMITPGRSHLRALADLNIGQVEISYFSGAKISYRGATEGEEPNICVISPAGEEESLGLVFSEGPRRPLISSEEKAFYKLHQAIATPSIFVADDRSVSRGDRGSVDGEMDHVNLSELRYLLESGQLVARERTREVEEAVNSAVSALSRQALRDSSRAGTEAESMYAKIIRDMDWDYELSGGVAKQEVEATIDEVRERSRGFADYGLFPIDQVEEIYNALPSRKNAKAFIPIRYFLVPYLNSLLVRIESMRDVHRAIHSYVSALNSFVSRKQFTFRIDEGLRLVLSDSGREIPMSALSSGEKHLVQLLSYAVIARENGSFFIIDEPEISLGIEWRRMLVPALLQCAKGGGAQFLLASHAVEILADYEESVINPMEMAE